MGDLAPDPSDRPVRQDTPAGPLTGPTIRALRDAQVGGLTRRTLLRTAIGTGIGLWVVEVLGGSIAFVWSAVGSVGAKVAVGTLADLESANPGLPVRDGFPVYVAAARAFVVLVDPARGGWTSGVDPTGDGSALNVRALSQRCPHLGCRPEPCLEDWWMHCPCHQSRYDRLGIKPAGLTYGPAPRSMDRYAVEVSDTGVLTVDMARIVMGPLPIALGQPGVIPPRVEHGCL
jgi:cytochrome b6-f complex iron-sulfur subunit